MNVTLPLFIERLDAVPPESVSEQIQAEIESTLGFVPSFFEPATLVPQILEHLWQQTLSAYINNPLPTVFKEKLSAYLSRFCAVPYCMICHSCSLHGLGVEGKDVLALLESPLPNDIEIDAHLQLLETCSSQLSNLSDISADLEASLLICSIYIAMQTEHTEHCRSQLRRLLGETNYYYLVTFIAYVKTCHTWMEAHPDTAYQDDRRVQNYFETLIEAAPDLSDFFANYWERVKYDRQTWAEQQAEIAERKRNEAALQKAVTQNLCLAQAIASTSEGVTITDPNQPDNPIIYCNAAFSRITGYEPEEVIGRNCRFLQGVDTDHEVVHQLHRAIQTQQEVKATLLNYRKNGQPFWNEVKIAPVFSELGELLYFIGIQTDITDRKQAEESLQRSKEQFHLIAQVTNDAIWEWDLLTNIIWWNEGMQALFGYTVEEIQPSPDWWSAHIHPNDRDRVLADRNAAIHSQKSSWSTEYYYRRANGDYAYINDRGYIIRDEAGTPLRMMGGMTDLTQHKQAEQKIREQAALLDVTTDAIFVQDLNYQILFWNKGAEQLYEWQIDEVLGQNAFTVLQPKGTPELQTAQKTVLAQGEWQGELHLVTKSGKKLTVASRWTLVHHEERPKSILVVNTDITEKKQLEAQFLRAQRMESIGTLASGIAHDLNNVLTPILSSAQLLLMQTNGNHKHERLLETIQNSARRGSALIKQVLSFARGIEGQRTPLQTRHLIAEIRQIVQETFPKSIEVQLDVANDLWLVSGDATQLHQVLMNLCVNARDAMPEGGVLSLSATNLWIDEHYAQMNLDAQVGAHILITITDTGMGIPTEILDRIFEPFFTTKELGKGTGLGLSTVLGIIRSHGGFVEVNSTIGEGTQFKICLPAIRADEIPQVTEEKLAFGHGEQILVVDDEAAIREISQASLEAFNYRVLTATDGIDAIALYAEHKQDISLVLIDLMMPLMDGATAIRTLRKLNPQVKIVATSGLMSSKQLADAISSDIQAFLPKPYTAKELIKHINHVLTNC